MQIINILVIDDNRGFSQLLKTALRTDPRHKGFLYNVQISHCKEEGFIKALCFPFDLILLDCDLVKRDKETETLRLVSTLTPLIFMSEKSEMRDVENAFLEKPIRPSRLHASIHKLLVMKKYKANFSNKGAPWPTHVDESRTSSWVLSLR